MQTNNFMESDTAFLTLPDMLSVSPEAVEEQRAPEITREAVRPSLSLWQEYRAQEASRGHFESILLAFGAVVAAPLVGYAIYATCRFATSGNFEAWVQLMTR